MKPTGHRNWIFAIGVALLMLGAATGVDTIAGFVLPINKMFVESSREIALAASVGLALNGIALLLLAVEPGPRSRR